MKSVSRDEVLDVLDKHRSAGFHVDSRLLREIAQPGQLHVVDLPDASDFFDLIWQSITETRPVAPMGKPRTLRDCASRLSNFGWRFDRLAESGYPWFSKCVDIDARFDFSSFGWLTLTPAVESERRESPEGTHYFYDGVHKSIVLAKKLLRDEVVYRHLQALLLTPRRS